MSKIKFLKENRHPAGNSRDKAMKLGFHISEDLDIET